MSDLISRQAVLDGIDKYIEKSQSTGTIDDFNSFAELVVKTLPSVENKGEWIAHDIHNCCTEFKCSKCGYTHIFTHLYGKPTADYSYCPNCGAYMKGGK